MAKGKGKAKTNPKWSVEAEVHLLRWLDDNKGTEGDLSKDEETAFNTLIADDEFLSHHPGIKTLPTDEEKKQNIHNRLKYFWTKFKLPKYEKAPYSKTIIYDRGSAVFDWKELEIRYPSLFSDEEFRRLKESAGLNSSATQETGTKRKSLDDQQPADDITAGPPHKRTRSQSKIPPNQGPSGSSGQQTQVNPATSHQTQQPNSSRPSRQRPTDRAQRRLNQQALMSDTDFANLPKIKRLLGNPDNETTRISDQGDIGIALMRIYDDIRRAVEEYLHACKVDADKPVILEPMSTYPAQLHELLARMLGNLDDTVDDRCKLFQHTQTDSRVGYELFLRSLLAVAVTYWCFRDEVVEDNVYRAFGGGLIKHVFETCKFLGDIFEHSKSNRRSRA